MLQHHRITTRRLAGKPTAGAVDGMRITPFDRARPHSP
ncbi:Hypothetical protein RY67_1277 [Bifidobacterium longum subsp. infantis]|uniref:Uncharacterized protein n=1 Tax=Bifidobacterium longum subsp. infantis TaxID=1682 RepID=A0A0M4MGY3_BIFLI|nr:Hypothetical protein RY67_1277 [Bifidobacterium longum subsp. infantis]